MRDPAGENERLVDIPAEQHHCIPATTFSEIGYKRPPMKASRVLMVKHRRQKSIRLLA